MEDSTPAPPAVPLPDPASVATTAPDHEGVSASASAPEHEVPSAPTSVPDQAESSAPASDRTAATSSAPNPRAPSAQQASPNDIRGFGSLEVDTDSDSTLGDEIESTTTSLHSEATDFKYEHGRRYHGYQDGKYALPNDDIEIRRLELQHRIWRIFLANRAGLAPISSNPRRALDLGCGTGAWAIDFAEAHPECQVTGIDLSPIQPQLVPPNVEFFVDDMTSQWVYPYKFDYIHTRSTLVGIRDWPKLIDEIWNHLNPGGWIEFQEYHWPFGCDDGSIEKYAPNFKKWNDTLEKAAKALGTKLDAILTTDKILAERGFKNIRFYYAKWPIGPWAKGKREKKVGALFKQDILTAFEGVSLRMFTKGLGWTPEDVAELVKEVEEEVRVGRMHAYFPMDFLWAQKPVDVMDSS